MIRRIVILASALIMSASALYAQTLEDVFANIQKAAQESFVKVEYTFYATVGQTVIDDKGYVEAQDGMWHLQGDTIEIYTSGDATWILDNGAREAVIEPAWTYEDLMNFYRSAASSGKAPEINAASVSAVQKKPASYFIPVLDDSWIVTDLR